MDALTGKASAISRSQEKVQILYIVLRIKFRSIDGGLSFFSGM